MPDVQVIATGSSSFDLLNEVNEPLTGRKWEFYLYPLSYRELIDHFGLINEKGLLERRLVYGSYPEVVTNPGNENEILHLLSSRCLSR
jgi:predicted AAA+ superfamily ATPase